MITYATYHVLRGGLDPTGLADPEQILRLLEAEQILRDSLNDPRIAGNRSSDAFIQTSTVLTAVQNLKQDLLREFEEETGIEMINRCIDESSEVVDAYKDLLDAVAGADATFTNVQRAAQLYLDGVGPEVEVPDWIESIAEDARLDAERAGRVADALDTARDAVQMWEALDHNSNASDRLQAFASLLRVGRRYLPLPMGCREYIEFLENALDSIGDSLDDIESDAGNANLEFWSDPRLIVLQDGEAPLPGGWFGNSWAERHIIGDGPYHGDR